MSFEIKKATRVGVIPWITFYSESGCGKTYSALLLARGLAGPNGDIAMIDTESRRGSLYADVIPGGYSVLDLDAPFHPARFIEALQAVYKTGARVAVVDSMSHEWEGLGSVCDMASELEAKSGKSGLHNWKMPKMEHAKLVQFMLRSPIPIITCVRAKFKTRQTKDERGKTIIVKDDVTSPIQAEDFIFDSTAHAEILPDHSIRLTKCSHPSLRECFPAKGPITIQHGEMVAKWCVAAGVPAKPTDPMVKTLKTKLWDITKAKHGGDQTAFKQWMVDECLIAPDCDLAALTAAQLSAVITQTEKKL